MHSIPHRMQFSRLDNMTSIRLQTRNPGIQPQSCEFKEIKIGAEIGQTVYYEVCMEMRRLRGIQTSPESESTGASK